MNKALVRSHLDYCDIIYHVPAVNGQTNLGVTIVASFSGYETILFSPVDVELEVT